MNLEWIGKAKERLVDWLGCRDLEVIQVVYEKELEDRKDIPQGEGKVKFESLNMITYLIV